MPTEFKDYYAALGVEPSASATEIKQAYRKLARKYHPDVSKEADAETRFKEVAEAHEVLHHAERRAAYDEVLAQRKSGHAFRDDSPGGASGWRDGFEFSGADDPTHSDFFEQLFGRRPSNEGARNTQRAGGDHHARVQIELEAAYLGGMRSISLRMPVADATGRMMMQRRQLDVNIPKGLRAGQHLRLAGQGSAGAHGGKAGDLYLEIEFTPHPRYRVEDRDVYMDVAIAPWEAALGSTLDLKLPDGEVHLTVPPDSPPGRRLRLNGRGIPSIPPGDLFVLLSIAQPSATTPQAQAAYRLMAASFPDFDPRPPLEASTP